MSSSRARAFQPRDVQMLQMLISAQTNPLACLSFYLSCHAAVSCPSHVSLLDEVFTLHSSQRCRSRLRCVATRLFDKLRESAHEDSIDVAVLSGLHDCCEHPAWASIMAGVCEVWSRVAHLCGNTFLAACCHTHVSTTAGQYQEEEDVLSRICQVT